MRLIDIKDLMREISTAPDDFRDDVIKALCNIEALDTDYCECTPIDCDKCEYRAECEVWGDLECCDCEFMDDDELFNDDEIMDMLPLSEDKHCDSCRWSIAFTDSEGSSVYVCAQRESHYYFRPVDSILGCVEWDG